MPLAALLAVCGEAALVAGTEAAAACAGAAVAGAVLESGWRRRLRGMTG